jgi:hypothetical protein
MDALIKYRFFTCSGFVILFQGSWFFITAGHVLKEEIDANVQKARIRIVSACLADYFGPDAKVFRPTIFDYAGTERIYVDDRKLGLDLGMMYLRPYLQMNLEANGVVPISEENWLRQHEVNFEAFGILGFPSNLVESFRRTGDFGEEIVGLVRPAFVGVQRLDDMPEHMEKSELPWLVGQISPNADPNRIKGMSGGPIFGLRQSADGSLRYWVVALQSWVKGRIILGCPVPVFMGILERSFQDFLKDWFPE